MPCCCKWYNAKGNAREQPLTPCASACANRRKQRDSKKYAKQVMAEKKKEKAQTRKAAVADVSKLRRQRARQGYAGELDMDKELAAMARKPFAPGERFRPGAHMLGQGKIKGKLRSY